MIILKRTDEYRCDTEQEATGLVEAMKDKAKEGDFEITAWNVTKKEKKAKGEVIDEAYVTKITSTYNTIWE